MFALYLLPIQSVSRHRLNPRTHVKLGAKIRPQKCTQKSTFRSKGEDSNKTVFTTWLLGRHV